MKTKLEGMIRRLKDCPTRNKRKCKNYNILPKVYDPLVGDPCYKFSRSAKERFFENSECAFLFILVKNSVQEKLINEKKVEATVSEIK